MGILFYHSVADNDLGNVFVFSGYFDDVNKVTTKDIFSDVNAKGMIPLALQPTVAMKSLQSRSPMLGYKADTFQKSAGCVDLTVIYNFILETTGGKLEAFRDTEMLKNIKSKIGVAIPDPNFAKLAFELMMAQVVWELNDFSNIKNVDTEYECSAELLAVLTVDGVEAGGVENATLKQENCEDTLFIELPSYYELTAEDEYVAFAKLPVKDQICTLYTDDRMYTTRYLDACRDSKSKLLEVVGDPKNNTMEIFENEQGFYKAVLNWINSNMKKAEVKALDADTQQYLFLLIYQMYILNWGHNERVPLRMLPETSTRSDDQLDSDGASRFVMRPECIPGDNACMSLKEFLTDAMVAYGDEILVNLLIQLCRWGARKPSCLVVGTSMDDLSDRVFDLNKGETIVQKQVKGELVEQDTDKFVCVGKVFSKPNFAVGYVRKIVYKDEAGTDFTVLMPVFFGDYLADFEKAGKEFVEEGNAVITLADTVGQNYTGYVNENVRQYVCQLGTENITLSREFNAMTALNTVLSSGAEKISAYAVNAPNAIFGLANKLMISINVVACFNYFREYAPVFADLKSTGSVDYPQWKAAIEKCNAVLGVFRSGGVAQAVADAKKEVESGIASMGGASVAAAGASSTFTSMPGTPVASTPVAPAASGQGLPTGGQGLPAGGVGPFYLRDASGCTNFCNVKYGNNIVCQVGVESKEIRGKLYSVFIILDPNNRRDVADSPENTKSVFTIMAHVVHAYMAIANAPENERVYFENNAALKYFAHAVIGLDGK